MSRERLSTLSVHGGETSKKPYEAITTPVVPSATYTFDKTQDIKDYFDGKIDREEYGRYGNPTVRAAELKIAALEGAEETALFASGMAAVTTTLLAMLRSGQHVVMTSDCYRRTRQFVGGALSRFGVESDLVAPGDYDALEAAIRPSTRLIISESPTNPYLRVADLERLVEIKKKKSGLKLLIDSTFATPINQRPIEMGVDLVLQSGTKYLGGHNDLLCGSVSGKSTLISALKDFRGVLGGVLDPQSAYLLIRGIKTLALRVSYQNASAMQIAQWLEQHSKVAQVFYPGLPSHPDHEVAAAQMKGFGGVISFLVDSDLDGVSQFIDRCRIPKIAPSLGGTESLIEQPSFMSYYELMPEERAAIGIKDNLVRLSIGIEDTADLLEDLEQALEAVP